MESIIPIGHTNWRHQHIPFGIKPADFMHHLYAIGKTGAGKSTLLQNMAIAQIENGSGVCIIDPHGDLSETLLNYIPKERINDVIYFNAADIDYPIAFNPMNGVYRESSPLVVSSLIEVLKKIWLDAWGPRLEYILRFSLLTLMEWPGSTLLDIQPLLTDASFRKEIRLQIKSDPVRNFWIHEFEKYSASLRTEAIASILNKIGAFTAHRLLRNIIGQQKSSFQIQEVMDRSKILICNLSKGEIGEDAAALLGSMILTALQNAALARAAIPEDKRAPFYVYVDEMHSFATLSFIDMLSESRKYKLGLFLTHQYLDQLPENIRSAIFGNIGTLISFRVGAGDARYVAHEFYPVFKDTDFIALPKYSIYLKLMIDGMTCKPFSAVTLPLKAPSVSYKNQIVSHSRSRYAKRREGVENEIKANLSGNEAELPNLFSQNQRDP